MRGGGLGKGDRGEEGLTVTHGFGNLDIIKLYVVNLKDVDKELCYSSC